MGGLVLKPGVGPAAQRWLGTEVVPAVRDHVRVAEPVPTPDGRWTVDGWGATRHVGEAVPADRTHDWDAVLRVGRSLHAALVALPRPAFLDARSDPWALADRAVWNEIGLPVHPAFAPVVRRLRRAVEHGPDVLGPDRLVHGDLTGNVLLTPTGEPVVIDVSPYWRPTAWAEGVVVADAVTWFDAPADLADHLGVPRAAVLRAMIFRVLTSSERAAGHDDDVVELEVERYRGALQSLGV